MFSRMMNVSNEIYCDKVENMKIIIKAYSMLLGSKAFTANAHYHLRSPYILYYMMAFKCLISRECNYGSFIHFDVTRMFRYFQVYK